MKRMKLSLPYEQIAAFCRKWNVSEFALFGSVLRDDFRPDSDVDVLVSFPSYEATPSLFDHVEMQGQLAEIFARPVNLLTRGGVQDSRNPIWKRTILETARVVYVAS
jgi:predicted nucleotidyltransferase